MTTSPSSYLQTLANDEAIAFVSSLQRLKAHLSQELQWINAQVQQKTVQLQGIQALLSEALALELMAAETHATAENSSLVAAPSIPVVVGVNATHESGLESTATANESVSAASTELLVAAIATLPVEPSTQPQRDDQEKLHAQTPRGSKLSATETNAAKAKPSNPSMHSAGKARQRGKASGLQRFLQRQWRDIVLTESVGEILDRASAPLSTDDVMAELYDGMSKEDYNRAKNSLANILSVGRSKGSWKSTGRGRYARLEARC